MGESDDGEANVKCLPILVMKFHVGNALTRSTTQRDEAPVRSQEDGRRDGAKRLPENHREDRQ